MLSVKALTIVLLLSCTRIATEVQAYKINLLPMGGALLVNRQTSDCPNYSDCDCEPWGMSCTVSNWDWFQCSDFPGSCDSSTSPSASSAVSKSTVSASTLSASKHPASTSSPYHISSTSKNPPKTTSSTSSSQSTSSSPAKPPPSPPKQNGPSYGVWLGYYEYVDGGAYPETEYFWRFWQNKGTSPPDYCNSQDISSTQDSDFFGSNAPVFPGSSITFNVADAGNRECTWSPGGGLSGNGGPGTLSCKGGPSAILCETVSDKREAICGPDYTPRVEPIASCTWQDPS